MVRVSALLTLFILSAGGCSVTPAHTSRSGAASLPDASSWPARSLEHARLRPEALPAGVTEVACLGTGCLYRLDLEHETEWPAHAELHIFLSSATPLDPTRAGSKITWEGGVWEIPNADTALMISVSNRKAMPIPTCGSP